MKSIYYVFRNFRFYVLLMFLLYCPCCYTGAQESAVPRPRGLIIGTGSSVLTIGTFTSVLDLGSLGVTSFDGSETDKPVYSKEEGMAHYILNPNWTGVLKVYETPIVGDDKEYMRQQYIVTTDSSKVIPSTFISDSDGCAAWATNLGFGYSYLGGYNYINLSKPINVKNLLEPVILILDNSGKKIVKINVKNYDEEITLTL